MECPTWQHFGTTPTFCTGLGKVLGHIAGYFCSILIHVLKIYTQKSKIVWLTPFWLNQPHEKIACSTVSNSNLIEHCIACTDTLAMGIYTYMTYTCTCRYF